MTLVIIFTCPWTELILLLMRTWKDSCSHLRRTRHCWTLPRALQGCLSPLRNHFLRFHREKTYKVIEGSIGSQLFFIFSPESS